MAIVVHKDQTGHIFDNSVTKGTHYRLIIACWITIQLPNSLCRFWSFLSVQRTSTLGCDGVRVSQSVVLYFLNFLPPLFFFIVLHCIFILCSTNHFSVDIYCLIFTHDLGLVQKCVNPSVQLFLFNRDGHKIARLVFQSGDYFNYKRLSKRHFLQGLYTKIIKWNRYPNKRKKTSYQQSLQLY